MMIRSKFNSITLVLFLVCQLVAGCGEDTVQPEKTLVTAVSQFSRTASELKTFLGAGSIDIDLSELKYDVEVFKITYTTKLDGSPVVASALVMLPKTTAEIAMVSFQHGTIASHREAPTTLPSSSTELILYAALASPGFVAVIPDLLGFGASSTTLHPYYVEDLTASAVQDALKAARDLANDKSLHFNSRLFLAGYSEGGYATMATHKAIEKDGLEGFSLIASFPASGGYDVKEMQKYFFQLDQYDNPFYIAFVAQAYKTYFNWSIPLSGFFKEPYATRIPSLFNGQNSGGQISAQLTTKIEDLLTDDLRSNIDTDPQYKFLVDAFNENSLTDWTPHVPMYMYHGDADITVPYSNSVTTYNKLIGSGASPEVVTLTTLPGADHGSGVIPYAELFIAKMLSLK